MGRHDDRYEHCGRDSVKAGGAVIDKDAGGAKLRGRRLGPRELRHCHGAAAFAPQVDGHCLKRSCS